MMQYSDDMKQGSNHVTEAPGSNMHFFRVLSVYRSLIVFKANELLLFSCKKVG